MEEMFERSQQAPPHPPNYKVERFTGDLGEWRKLIERFLSGDRQFNIEFGERGGETEQYTSLGVRTFLPSTV